jgi:uncharacterized protein
MDQQTRNNSLAELVQTIGAEITRFDTLRLNNRFSIITNDRMLLSQSYVEHGIIQILIDQPVDDAYKNGVDIFADDFDADDIKKFQHYLDMEGIIDIYAQARKWTRLFGGGGVLINCGQKLDKAFRIDTITEKTPLEFYAVDRWEVSYMPVANAVDQTAVDKREVPYNYYGHPIHRTNLIRLEGKQAPSLIRGQFSGWGVSEIERLLKSYNLFLKHSDVIFELLDESKIDVWKILGFNESLASKAGQQITTDRIQYSTQLKNYKNALILDKEDDYEQKQLTYSGLSEILKEIRIGLACDCRMPLTKLFGISASGFNAGEEDLENYYSMVENEIRSKDKAGLMQMLKVCSQKLFGFVPESLRFEFKPLRTMSSKDESELKTQILNRITSAYQNGMLPEDAAVKQINAAKVFPLDLKEGEALSLDELHDMQGESVGSSAPAPKTDTVL